MLLKPGPGSQPDLYISLILCSSGSHFVNGDLHSGESQFCFVVVFWCLTWFYFMFYFLTNTFFLYFTYRPVFPPFFLPVPSPNSRLPPPPSTHSSLVPPTSTLDHTLNFETNDGIFTWLSQNSKFLIKQVSGAVCPRCITKISTPTCSWGCGGQSHCCLAWFC